MPRQEFCGPVCELGYGNVNVDEFVVDSGIFDLDDGIQEIVLFLAGEISPRPSETCLAIAGGAKKQISRPGQQAQ